MIDPAKPAGPDLARLRESLAGQSGRRYWKSLEEAAGTPEFQEQLAREFPALATEFNDPVGRRRFLGLMGASMALAGLTACTRQPAEWIAPYAEAPEKLLPGKPVYYATALTLAGWATGALVETHEGRPTKIEGNPDHPASLGATDVFMQAASLGLYDPDRSRTLTFLGDIHPWSDLLGGLAEAVKAQKPRGGAGIRILTGTVTSPSQTRMLKAALAALPEARWYVWEPAGRDNTREGLSLAFGEPLALHHDYAAADAVLSVDADFLGPGPGQTRAIRGFTRRRRAEGGGGMSRLYVAEPTPTGTGSMADHRLRLGSGEMELVLRAVASALGLQVWLPSPQPPAWGRIEPFARAAAKDLREARGGGLVVVGEGQPARVHAHALNAHLGNAGRAVRYSDPIESLPPDEFVGARGLRRLAGEMESGRVELLLVLGGNPVYSAPADLRFAEKLSRVGLSIHLGLHDDETAATCQWHVPQAHELECWGDARALDGTATIQQPMIEPLYGGRTPLELLAVLTGQTGRSAHDLLMDHWKEASGAGAGFERWWRKALHDGIVPGSAVPFREVVPRGGLLESPAAPGGAGDNGLFELVFRPDASVWDGCFANNGWLQELPRPASRLTWDNAALISPAAAERLGVANGDVLELTSDAAGAGPLRAPAWIVPGQADGTLVVHLGYGRRRGGRAAEGAGVDAGAARTCETLWIAPAVRARRTGESRLLVTTQDHHSMEGRQLVRWATVEEAASHPEFAKHAGHDPAPDESLYKPWSYDGHAWGMVIDLNSCVGCNACVIGCQSENNIPVVGKEQVANGREMHWIRVDRYFEGDLDEPAMWHQPVTCMQCENAPCEPVCPVGATVHSSEGLNDMVYNRCVGTRYCSNNCPYKVRRFNFLLYSDFKTPSLKLLNNPDVSVRSRGVMEKCTYCVQRINGARAAAHREDRQIRDGEVVTACQQACPASAITFGDLNDPASRVAKLKADPRNYGLLTDLNTRPRTTYLAALRNPSADLPEDGKDEG